jgi:hypothetical protein
MVYLTMTQVGIYIDMTVRCINLFSISALQFGCQKLCLDV